MTRFEELRIQQMMRLGCCACAYVEIPYPADECHHILYGNRRMGDWFTIPLCRGHHQGTWTVEQKEVLSHISVQRRQNHLIAISDGRKAFTAVYPTERELWDMTQDRLGLTWPMPKLVPRAA